MYVALGEDLEKDVRDICVICCKGKEIKVVPVLN
jgi:hypothetical protein